MGKKKKRRDHGEFPDNGDDPAACSPVASFSECTGLIPSGSCDSEEEFNIAKSLYLSGTVSIPKSR